jgi:hypothetical protein
MKSSLTSSYLSLDNLTKEQNYLVRTILSTVTTQHDCMADHLYYTRKLLKVYELLDYHHLIKILFFHSF